MPFIASLVTATMRMPCERSTPVWRSQGRLRHLLGGEIDVIRRRADEDWQAILGRYENV
jgi:hypothetical protein